MPRHALTFSQARNVCRKLRCLHERMPQGDSPQVIKVIEWHPNALYSKIPEIVDTWRSDLQGKGRSKLASSIASPTENESLFEEGWAEAVKREVNGVGSEVSKEVDVA
jgi:hypothetical protein